MTDEQVPKMVHVTCPNCEEDIDVPDLGTAEMACPKCSFVFKTGQTPSRKENSGNTQPTWQHYLIILSLFPASFFLPLFLTKFMERPALNSLYLVASGGLFLVVLFLGIMEAGAVLFASSQANGVSGAGFLARTP